MFARGFALLPLVLAVSASHLVGHDICNGSNLSCCNTLLTYQDSKQALAMLGINLNLPNDTILGIGCSPISGTNAIGGNGCTQQVACCKDNVFNGLVGVDCTPVNLSI